MARNERRESCDERCVFKRLLSYIEAKSTGNELPRFYNALEFAKTILPVFNFQTRLPILFPSTSARNRLLTMDILF